MAGGGDKPGTEGAAATGNSSTHEVTGLLHAWSAGDEDALERLVPMVYPELRRIARRYMGRERPGHTLQTTALVNEAYLRLVDVGAMSWQDRSHFFAICARVMRRILIDLARARQYQKRGGGQTRVCLDEGRVAKRQPPADILALDDALKALSSLDARKGQVVELRFFGGLSVAETAHVLQVSSETVMRDWRLAKTWLWRELSQEKRDGG
jgi:RNA polymerase sigma factor (TIGR02999 family)